MDTKDVRIFCELAFNDLIQGSSRHPTPPEIGRKLGIDEKTVRLRMKKMEESGFVKYYQAYPNFSLFGFVVQGLCRFEAMNVPTKFNALKFVNNLPGVVEAFDYLGPMTTVSMIGTSVQEIVSLSERIASEFELSRTSLGDRELIVPQSQPDVLDWQIIKELRYKGQATPKEISESLSITQRMTRYRINKLVSSAALQIRPVINAQKQEGIVFYELGVSIEASKRNEIGRAIQEIHGEKMWSLRVAPNGTLIVDLFGFTLAEPEDTAMQLLSLDGVKWCSNSILKEVLEPTRPNWVDLLIEERSNPAKDSIKSS